MLSRRRKKLEARLEELRLEARADVLRENLGEYVVKRKFDVPDNLDDAAVRAPQGWFRIPVRDG